MTDYTFATSRSASRLKASLLACASIGLLAAFAPGVASAQSAGDATLGEIVVTARRQNESLQNVPASVVPVTGEALQNLQIRNAFDVQKAVPGLRLNPPDRGSGGVYGLRGTTWDVTSGQFSTIAFYENDVGMNAGHIFDGGVVYDISQIEVLRGPQGTTRGLSAPSGAVTVRTNRPNLEGFGGSIEGMATDMHSRYATGMINIPIIEDVFGVRIAAVYNNSPLNYARPIYPGSPRGRQETTGERISVRLAPSPLFEADVMYEHRQTNSRTFEPVAGPGRPSGIVASPPLTPEQRASLQSYPYLGYGYGEYLTARVQSHFAGHTLEYVGGMAYRDTKYRGPGDITGVVPGAGLVLYTQPKVRTWQSTQELRFSSDPAPGRFIDYTVGLFYQWFSTRGLVTSARTALPGAFGPPGAPLNLNNPNSRYILDVNAGFDQFNQEFSGFASTTLHFGDKIDLTAGIRQMRSTFKSKIAITGSPAAAAVALPAAFCAPSGGTPSAYYPGVCDFPVALNIPSSSFEKKESPTIYNVSLSYKVTPDIMIYGSTGTSFRPANSSIGLRGTFAISSNPQLRNLVFHPSEKATNYEVGFKATFWERRARLNVTAFNQKFKGFQTAVRGIYFLDISTTPPAPSQQNFFVQGDVRVRGIDAEGALKLTPNWDVAAQFSYSKDKILGSGLLCNLGAATAPIFNTLDPTSGRNIISFCPGGHASQDPPWTLTMTSNYEQPITDDINGFVRGLAYHASKNARRPEMTARQYTTLDLYVGAKSREAGWEASLFAKNIFNTFRVLSREADLTPNGVTSFPQLTALPVGYYLVRTTTPREVGVSVRYAFGSR